MENEVIDVTPDVEREIMEIVIGIPKNTGMLKVVALTIDESGEPKEFAGTFNLEQILLAKAKFMQLARRGDEDDTTVEERSAVGGDSGAEEDGGSGRGVNAGDPENISGNGAGCGTGSDTDSEEEGQAEEG